MNVKARLLIVENISVVRNDLGNTFRNPPLHWPDAYDIDEFDVELAASGESARKHIAAVSTRGPFDVVLLDLHLPESDGGEIEELKVGLDVLDLLNHGIARRVVITTAWYNQPETAIALQRRSDLVFVAKPFARRNIDVFRIVAEAYRSTQETNFSENLIANFSRALPALLCPLSRRTVPKDLQPARKAVDMLFEHVVFHVLNRLFFLRAFQFGNAVPGEVVPDGEFLFPREQGWCRVIYDAKSSIRGFSAVRNDARQFADYVRKSRDLPGGEIEQTVSFFIVFCNPETGMPVNAHRTEVARAGAKLIYWPVDSLQHLAETLPGTALNRFDWFDLLSDGTPRIDHAAVDRALAKINRRLTWGTNL